MSNVIEIQSFLGFIIIHIHIQLHQLRSVIIC